MQITIGKLFSLLIAAAYVISMVTQSHGINVCLIGICIFLLIPLGLIWFPEEIGAFTGYVGRGGIVDTETPAIMLTVMGWLILVAPPLFIYFVLK